MKRPKKKDSCLSCGLIFISIPTAVIILLWIATFYQCVYHGPRKDILRIFPNAEIRVAHYFDPFQPGIVQDLLMPEGYILPGVRADVFFDGEGKLVSFKDIERLNGTVSNLNIKNCRITDWEEFVLHPTKYMGIRIEGSTFIGGNGESRAVLERFRRIEIPSIEYKFGGE